MDRSIARRLNRLNREFYDAFAPDFARSRARLHSGIERVLGAWAPVGRLLDLGCGDGRVGRALAGGDFGPWTGRWVGVDASAGLLAQGEKAGEVRRLDLDEPGWSGEVPGAPFDHLVAFSVLHHLPSASARAGFLRECRTLLRPGGGFAFSVWQLTHLERFRRRLRDWSEVGLSPADVEPGDLLLDWRRGGEALRYVHEFDEAELRALCEGAGLRVDTTFRSDGETGDLGLYVMGGRD